MNGLFRQVNLDGLPQAGAWPGLHELRPLARLPKDQQQRQGSHHPEDRSHEQDPASMIRLKAPYDPKGMVKANRLPRIEKNMRVDVSAVLSS